MAFWDPRSEDDHRAMRDLIAPLIVASRDRNFITPEAAKAQTYAWRLSLADVPRPILEETIAAIVRRGVTWMPRPGDVKAECAKVLAAKRTAVRLEAMKTCPHMTGGWQEVTINGVVRTERCACWQAGKAAADRIGAALELLPAREDQMEMERS